MRRYWLTAITGILVFATVAATGQNVRMGTRYHLIDKDIESVTTGFEDIEVTTVRTVDGNCETRMRTPDGRAIGAPLVARPEQVRLVAGGQRTPGAPDAIHVDLQPLDAVNADRYLAWKDGKLATRRLFAETPADLIGTEGPVELEAAAADVRWVRSRSGRLEAFSRIGRTGFVDGRELPVFTSVVREDEQVLATMAWFPKTEILAFQTRWHPEPQYFVGKDLPGGWTFKPNMAWANVQLLSFVKSAESLGAHNRGGRFQPVTHNSPGCDGLHWLDGTVFRNCCDDHDLCYYKEDPDCTAYSWWFQESWSCQQCNIDIIFCFPATVIDCFYAPNYCVLFPVYDWNPQEPNCYIYSGCSCPAWCYGCQTVFGQGPCP